MTTTLRLVPRWPADLAVRETAQTGAHSGDELEVRQLAPIAKPVRGRVGFESDYSLPVDRAPKPFTATRPMSAATRASLTKSSIRGTTFGFAGALDPSAPVWRAAYAGLQLAAGVVIGIAFAAAGVAIWSGVALW